MPQFIRESRVEATPQVVFSFHESPGALARLIPPWEDVRLVQGGDSLRPGSRVVLSVKFGPIRFPWVAEHTEYVSGRMFADRQLSGPFSSWYHRHFFLCDGAGGTLMRDVIDYDPPLGIVGRWFGTALITGKLERMFEFRHRRVREIVDSRDFDGTLGLSPDANR
jgi:ligand-binding SRPBCC domain-containing protein